MSDSRVIVLNFPPAARTSARIREALMRRVVVTVEGEAKKVLRPGRGVRTGTMRRDIKGRVERAGERGIVGTSVNYARAVHEGTRPHVITARRRRALRFKIGGEIVFRRRVRHPGTQAIPFLLEGVAASRDSLPAIISREGQRMIDEALGR